MKIKVKPEGRKDIFLPDKVSLVNWLRLKNFDQVHNMKQAGHVLLGADYSLDSVIEEVYNSDRLALTINEQAVHNMNHSLSVIKGNSLSLFDIGVITEEDLEIQGE